MTKEEYIVEYDSLIEQERELFRKKKQLELDFIKEHKRFNYDDKVVLTVGERSWLGKVIPETRTEAYIDGFSVWKGVLSYRFKKAKKDGSKSSQQLHQYSFDKIELLEPAKP